MTMLLSPKANYDKLPESRKAVLEFVRMFMDEHGYAPTIREIGAGTGITSTSVVNYNLNKLAQVGLLERAKSISRGLRVPDQRTPQPRIHLEIPLLKQPITDFSQPIPHGVKTHTIPTQWLSGKPLSDVYALLVETHLMYDAMVGAGDIIVLQRQEWIEDGGIALVQLQPQQEIRIRKIKYEGESVRLEPLLSVMQPLRRPCAEVKVIGKVLGLLRQF